MTYTLETVPCPLKLTCNVSGKVTIYTNRDYILKKITEYGSLEALLKGYICRAAKPGLKPAKAAKVPGRTWKGQGIIKKEESVSTTTIVPEASPTVIMHNTYKLEDTKTEEFDGHYECNVYAPKASTENLDYQTFDFRKKNQNNGCISNGN